MTSISDALRWTSPDDGQDPLTMKELVIRYRKKLPVIVSVIDGYFGCYGQDIGSNEMYWIGDIVRQERILVRDKKNRYFSIPFDYRIMFHIATDTDKMSKSVMPLREAIDSLNSVSSTADHEILLQSDQPVTVGIGAKRTKFGRLGVLKIVDKYELKYLQAHSIYDNKLDTRTTPIPVFMDLTFSVAIGCRYGTEQQFREWTTQVNAIGNCYQHQDPNILCNEIIYLDQSPDEELNEGHYEYMRPMNVVFTQDEHSYELIGGIKDDHAPETTTIMSLETGITSLEISTTSQPEVPPFNPDEPPILPSLPLGPADSRRSARRVRNFVRSQSDEILTGDCSSPPPVPARQPRLGGWGLGIRPNPSTLRSSPPPPPPPVSPSVSRSVDDPNDSTVKSRVRGASVSVSSTCGSRATPTAATEPATSTTRSESTLSFRKYLFASDVPRDLDFASLSKEDMAHCLCLLNMWTFAQRFVELDIDGALLLTLNEDILRTDLGFRTSEARKLMRFVREGWRPPRKRHFPLTQ